jgi:hypothetical protein
VLGPDQSEIIYAYSDGWTIRRLHRKDDQLREGKLMQNCLRGATRTDVNCWSLRDPDNLPHCSFSTWCIDPDDDLDEIPRKPLSDGTLFLFAPRSLLLVGGVKGCPTKAAHQARLIEFGGSDASQVADDFPADTESRLIVVGRTLATAWNGNILGLARTGT